MSTNKSNKFQFVNIEDIEPKKIDSINIVDSPKEVNVDSISDVLDTKLSKRISLYFGYEARILLSIVISIVFILVSCFLITKVMNHKVNVQYPYNEEANVTYKVCSKDGECLGEFNKYSFENTKLIHMKYKYNLLFSKDINYKLSYSIIATTKIYDKKSSNRVYYKNEDVLVDKKELDTVNSSIVLDEDVNILINRYRNIVESNKYRYTSEYEAKLDVSLYVYEDNETRNVSSIKLPLTGDEFEIEKTGISNADKFVELETNRWDSYTILIAIISTLLMGFALVIIYRTTRLVLKTYNNRSTYEQTLYDILNKYDSIIVIARNGYETNVVRKVVKLDSFDELLGLKDKINKPIIYSRVNDVKSEFLLESDDILYKYILKEADIES